LVSDGGGLISDQDLVGEDPGVLAGVDGANANVTRFLGPDRL
jgi:hypothetical protein